MKKLFVSYRSADSDKVDMIVARLRSSYTEDGRQEYQVWQDKDSIPAGIDWWEAIVSGIENCDIFIFMLSEGSVNSENCLAELSYAHQLNKPIVPIVLEGQYKLNRQTGKHQLIIADEDIPDELVQRRYQYLWYEGTSFHSQFDTAMAYIDRRNYPTLPADPPPDPSNYNDPDNKSSHIYQQAVDAAMRGNFVAADRQFRRLINRQDDEFKDEATEWIHLITAYQNIVKLHEQEYTRFKVAEHLDPYFRQFPKKFIEIFDPKNLRELYGMLRPKGTKKSERLYITISDEPDDPSLVDANVADEDSTETKSESSTTSEPSNLESADNAHRTWSDGEQTNTHHNELRQLLDKAETATDQGDYEEAETLLEQVEKEDQDGTFEQESKVLSEKIPKFQVRNNHYRQIKDQMTISLESAIEEWNRFEQIYHGYDPDNIGGQISDYLQRKEQRLREIEEARLATLNEMLASVQAAINVGSYEMAKQILHELENHDTENRFINERQIARDSIMAFQERTRQYAELKTTIQESPQVAIERWTEFLMHYPDYDPDNLAATMETYLQQAEQERLNTQRAKILGLVHQAEAAIKREDWQTAQQFMSDTFALMEDVGELIYEERIESISDKLNKLTEVTKVRTWLEEAYHALENQQSITANDILKQMSDGVLSDWLNTESEEYARLVADKKTYEAYWKAKDDKLGKRDILKALEAFKQDYPDFKSEEVDNQIIAYQQQVAAQDNPEMISVDMVKALSTSTTDVTGNTIKNELSAMGFQWIESGIEQFWGFYSPAGSMDVSISSDGFYVAVASRDRKIRIWNIITGKQIATLEGHTHVVSCVAFSPDGKTLASGSWDKTVRLWDMTSKKQTLKISDYRKNVRAIAFSPDGQNIAVGSGGMLGGNSRVRIFPVGKKKSTVEMSNISARVEQVTYSTVGVSIASRSYLENTVMIWDYTDGKLLHKLGHDSYVEDMAWSPDQQYIATASRNAVIVWDRSGKEKYRIALRSNNITFSQDSHVLIIALTDSIVFWCIHEEETTVKYVFRTRHQNPILALSPDGKRLICTDESNGNVLILGIPQREPTN